MLPLPLKFTQAHFTARDCHSAGRGSAARGDSSMGLLAYRSSRADWDFRRRNRRVERGSLAREHGFRRDDSLLMMLSAGAAVN